MVYRRSSVTLARPACSSRTAAQERETRAKAAAPSRGNRQSRLSTRTFYKPRRFTPRPHSVVRKTRRKYRGIPDDAEFSLESQQVQASELIENQEDWSSGLKKFTKSLDVTDWQVDSGQGWVDVTHWNETVEYPVWRLETNTGSVLKAADTHILIREDGSEIFLRDCLGVKLQTVSGLETVMSVEPTGETAVMYDLTVDSPDHTYYTNGILSHNTTVAAGYLLWYAMFNDDSTILIASNKFDGAQEIMHRVRYAYESIPDHIRAGVRTYNKRSIDFDNGSRIVATATTENTGRGMSLSLIYCLGGENTVEIRNKTSGQESVVRLDELFDLLNT